MKKLKISIILFLGIVFVFFNQCFFIGKLPRKYFIDSYLKNIHKEDKEDFFNSRSLFCIFTITAILLLILFFWAVLAFNNSKNAIFKDSGETYFAKFKERYLKAVKDVEKKREKNSIINTNRHQDNIENPNENDNLNLNSSCLNDERSMKEIDKEIYQKILNVRKRVPGRGIKKDFLQFCWNYCYPKYSHESGFPGYKKGDGRHFGFSVNNEKNSEFRKIETSIKNDIKSLFDIDEDSEYKGNDKKFDLEKVLSKDDFSSILKSNSWFECKEVFEVSDNYDDLLQKFKKCVEENAKCGFIKEEDKNVYLEYFDEDAKYDDLFSKEKCQRNKELFDNKTNDLINVIKKKSEENNHFAEELKKDRLKLIKRIYKKNILEKDCGAVAAIDIAELIVSLCSRAIISMLSEIKTGKDLPKNSKLNFGHKESFSEEDFEEEEYHLFNLRPYDYKKFKGRDIFERFIEIKVPKIYYENRLNDFIKGLEKFGIKLGYEEEYEDE